MGFFLEFPYFCEGSVIILALIEISSSEFEIMLINVLESYWDIVNSSNFAYFLVLAVLQKLGLV